MICEPLGPSTRIQLEDTLKRYAEGIAAGVEKHVTDGTLTLETLGDLLTKAVELGKLTAVVEHDNVARKLPPNYRNG